VQQKLIVKKPGTYQMGTTAQGVSAMQCRIDDPEGWPIAAVPSSCNGTRELRAGTYLWTQLPLTVESMRHTTLNKTREEVVLKGSKPHAASTSSRGTAPSSLRAARTSSRSHSRARRRST
jgi:hypothetical protein